MMEIIKRFLNPLGALFAAAAAVGIGVLLFKGHWLLPLAASVICGLSIFGCFLIGKNRLSRYPRFGSFLMESGYALLLLAAAWAGGLLFWVVVTKTPAKDASELSKQAFSGIVSAVTVYLGAVIIKLDIPWNPVKTAFQKTFANKFNTRGDAIEADADNAVRRDDYGAQQAGEVVSGWGWQARRLRAKQIGRALKQKTAAADKAAADKATADKPAADKVAADKARPSP